MMANLPWILGVIAAIIFFAVWEYAAFRWPSRYNTLSHFIYSIGSTWPLSIWIMGVFCGMLAAHFFWHWCPAGSLNVGMLR